MANTSVPIGYLERVTSAPEAYDGFGTETVRLLGSADRSGNPFRLVSIAHQHEGWQSGRYQSGMYVCIPLALFRDMEDVLTRRP